MGPTGTAELFYEVPWVFKQIPHLCLLPHNMIRNNVDFLSNRAFRSWFSAELCKWPRCDLWELGGKKEPGEVWEQAVGEHVRRFAVSWHLLPRWKSSYPQAGISGNALKMQGQHNTGSSLTPVRVVGESQWLLSLFISSGKNKSNGLWGKD